MNRTQTIVTPTGPLSVITPIAQQLLTEGVISGTLNGDLHATDAATVKAAIMARGVCDFCSAPGPSHVFDVPDFDMPFTQDKTTSTGGWAACDACAALVHGNRRKQLLARSIDNMAFPKFSKLAIEELHERFWSGLQDMEAATAIFKGVSDFVDDKPDLPPLVGKPTDRDKRLDAIAKITGLTRADLETALTEKDASKFLTPQLAGRLLEWRKKFGDKLAPRQLADLFIPPKQPLPNIVPHWQAALDAKFEAAANLRSFFTATDHSESFPESVDVHDKAALLRMAKMAQARKALKDMGFGTDARVLAEATAYSFNADTTAAIREASQGIPHDAPLSSVEPPNTGSGWFWFNEPLALIATRVSEHTHALLWTWVALPELKTPSTQVEMMLDPQDIGKAALMFSVYVRDDKGKPFMHVSTKSQLLPATRWFWPISMTFDEMIAFNTASWHATYGTGTPLEHDSSIMGLDATLDVVRTMSLFFVMSCVWFRQTVPGGAKKVNPVLTQETGHIERHARKRYQKDFKLDAPPVVKVVALRKSARTEVEGDLSPRPAGSREYHVRWIVKGHPRMQACGPGRADRKLIWIDSYPAGPEEKPLKVKTTVYAVVR